MITPHTGPVVFKLFLQIVRNDENSDVLLANKSKDRCYERGFAVTAVCPCNG